MALDIHTALGMAIPVRPIKALRAVTGVTEVEEGLHSLQEVRVRRRNACFLAGGWWLRTLAPALLKVLQTALLTSLGGGGGYSGGAGGDHAGNPGGAGGNWVNTDSANGPVGNAASASTFTGGGNGQFTVAPQII